VETLIGPCFHFMEDKEMINGAWSFWIVSGLALILALNLALWATYLWKCEIKKNKYKEYE